MNKMYYRSLRQIIFPLLLIAFIKANPNNFVGEELHYSAGFRFIPAGEAILSFQMDSLNSETVYVLTTSVKTNSFLDAFYEVRDEIQSWLNTENLSLKKIIQSIREGNYIREHESIIQGDSLAISADNSKSLPGEVYDPVAFIYYLRTQNIELGNIYRFFSYSRKKIKEVMVNITAKETIQVSAGTFTCFKVEPVALDGKPLLKNNGEMRIWLSDDSLKLPVKIEQQTNLGTMIMKLKGINHSSP